MYILSLRVLLRNYLIIIFKGILVYHFVIILNYYKNCHFILIEHLENFSIRVSLLIRIFIYFFYKY